MDDYIRSPQEACEDDLMAANKQIATLAAREHEAAALLLRIHRQGAVWPNTMLGDDLNKWAERRAKIVPAQEKQP